MIHGLGSARSAWEPMRPQLERHFDLIAFDLPGFGEQPWPDGEMSPTMDSLATAVEEEIERLGLERPFVAGNSMGGWIALELGRRGAARDVVAICPVGGNTAAEQRKSRRVLQGTRIAARTCEPIAGVIANVRPLRWAGLRGAVSDPGLVHPEDAIAATRNMARCTGFPLLLGDVAGPAGTIDETRRRFAGSDFPALILFGTCDRVLSPRGGVRMGEAIPGAKLTELSGLGHAPYMDHPAEIAGLIRERFGGNPAIPAQSV
jgi:pimeloyl-ACP methyl ester carboxylesterase